MCDLLSRVRPSEDDLCELDNLETISLAWDLYHFDGAIIDSHLNADGIACSDRQLRCSSGSPDVDFNSSALKGSPSQDAHAGAKRKIDTSSLSSYTRVHLAIGRATSYRISSTNQLSLKDLELDRTPVYPLAALNTFEAVVQFPRPLRRNLSFSRPCDDHCRWSSSSTPPGSGPSSPTTHAAPGYDASELACLIRAKLNGMEPKLTFNAKDCHDQLLLSCSRLCATKVYDGLYRNVRGCCPLPENRLVYFEVYICAQRPERGVCVGISTSALPLNILTGSKPSSIGWYSSGEMVLKGKWLPFGPAMRPGCTVGVLARIQRTPGASSGVAHISCSLDGQMVQSEYELELPNVEDPLFPTVSLYSTGSSVVCHFSGDDIRYSNHLPLDTVTLDLVPIRCC